MKKLFAGKRRGMTLVELAIVLGVVGLVLGAIWVAAGSVQRKQASQETIETISEISDRTRALYRAAPTVTAARLADTVAKQISANLFPENVVVDNDEVRNVWGGDINIGFKRTNNVIIGFSIAVTLPATMNVSSRNESCAALVSIRSVSGKSNKAPAIVSSVPVPSESTISAEDLSPDAIPVYSYVNAGGWKNVSNKNVSGVLSAIGSSGCTGAAFFYKL